MSGLFSTTGVHILAGGQYGSEGKGALAAWLAHEAAEKEHEFAGVITSAGPNSGHTSYFYDEKIVLKQLPTFAVHMALYGQLIPVYFSAGSIIDAEILVAEHRRFPDIPIYVHPCAAVVSYKDVASEIDIEGTIFKVAGTRSGTGAALARKVQRDPSAIYFNHSQRLFPYYESIVEPDYRAYFMEISQGFSLGLNEAKFYPKTTSRECTFMQGMADARIAPRHFSKGYLCFRTYPIRVGNIDGFSSGDWYADQSEIDWSMIGVPAELTTVTKRERRVATFSWNQFSDSMDANMPTHVFINFMNYLSPHDQFQLYSKLKDKQHEFSWYYEHIFGYGAGVDQIKYQGVSGTEAI